MRRSDSDLRDVWGNWLEAARFICEAQTVVSARLMLFATGGPQAAAEAHRMICEKVTAFSEARAAAEQALADGLGIYVAAERAYSPLRQCVRANSARLIHTAH